MESLFLPIVTVLKKRRIVMKICELIDKRSYFQKMKRKKNKKINAPTFEPRPAKSYFIANGRFSHSGSHMLMVPKSARAHSIKSRVVPKSAVARERVNKHNLIMRKSKGRTCA